MKNGLIASGLLLGAAAMVQPSPTDSPPLPATPPDVAQAPPLPGDDIFAPDRPSVETPVTVWPDDVVDARPGRLAFVRIPHPQRPGGGYQTRLVEMVRIQGYAASCKCTTAGSPIGSQWLGVDGLIYVKQADSTFTKRGSEPVLLADARPAGTWGTAAFAADT